MQYKGFQFLTAGCMTLLIGAMRLLACTQRHSDCAEMYVRRARAT